MLSKNKNQKAVLQKETIYKEKKNLCFVFFESLDKKTNKLGFEFSISSYKLTLSH